MIDFGGVGVGDVPIALVLDRKQVVLDVGCGTGVLSCFAARAGACKVIGVDRSDIVTKAREVVKDNGFEGVVTLVKVCVCMYVCVCLSLCGRGKGGIE